MLRNAVLAVAVTLLGVMLLAATWDPVAWPWLIVAILLVIGTVFERRYHNRSEGRPGGAGWERTDERFRDETTGRLVTVWYNRVTGERRYDEGGAS
jgi:hypothetical protein